MCIESNDFLFKYKNVYEKTIHRSYYYDIFLFEYRGLYLDILL